MTCNSDELDPKEELKMTRLTVAKLLTQKHDMSKLNRNLRFQLMTIKKELLSLKTSFVVQKSKMKSKIMMLRNENQRLSNDLKSFMTDDGEFMSDENGVIDVTSNDGVPKTPPSKSTNFVSSFTPSKK